MYAVYDIKDHEQCIGIFDKAKDIAAYFGMSLDSIHSGRSKGCLIKQRYQVEKIEEEDTPEEEPNPYCFNELVKEFMPEKHNFIEFDYFKDEIKKHMNMIIINEEWKEIANFNYSVSNYGRVKNNTTNKFKELRTGKYGYQINLWDKSKSKMFTLSRLVANYFIREVQQNERVIHIDGDIRNNYFKNLKIVDR